MKNIFNTIKVVFTVFSLLLFSVSTVFAQAETVTAIDEKCEVCTDFKAISDMENYGKNGCRIFQGLCDLKSNSATIILESDETVLNDSEKAISVEGGTTSDLMFYIDGLEETHHDVSLKISFVNGKGSEIVGSGTKNFQEYTFNEQNELRSVRGVQKIKVIQANENLVITTKVNLPESNGQPMFIKIDLTSTNPLTKVTKSVKTYYKQVRL